MFRYVFFEGHVLTVMTEPYPHLDDCLEHDYGSCDLHNRVERGRIGSVLAFDSAEDIEESIVVQYHLYVSPGLAASFTH